MKIILPLSLVLWALPVLHAETARRTPDERQAHHETAHAKVQEKRTEWQSLSPEERAAKKAGARQKVQDRGGVARAKAESHPYGTK